MNFFSSLLAAANQYRLINYDFPSILPETLNWPSEWLVAIGIIAGSFGIGILFANANRLKEYGWKIGLILTTLLLSVFLVLFGEYKLGVDLKGGVILVYEVDEKETAALHPQGRTDDWSMNALVQVVRDRLNPDGLKEIVVRPFGPKQIEIVVPETDPDEVKKIKQLIITGGALQFMVVASETHDASLLEAAQAQYERPRDRLKRDVTLEGGERVGYWARLGRENTAEQGGTVVAPFRELDSIREGFIRDARTGEIIELTQQQRISYSQSNPLFQTFLDKRGTRDVDVLLVYDAAYDVRGEDLRTTTKGRDQQLRPCIFFTMKGEGIFKMGALTQENIKRKLAIVFDNTLLSAPVIQSRIDENGQITGNFTDDEVQFIVDILKSGSMPVVLQKAPISENQIGSILGRDTIEKGSRSVVWALGLVLLFMACYYRFAGLVACFALTLNLLLTVAIMILLRAPFTLPGLAGLVLTVAMSVDANVLISERMREELTRGATLRMAIRNGFDKALSAIIDGNLTTLLTAMVLYAIGTDQIRGFGITLMLGNITSMFTAIFCARVIFDLSERLRWKKTLGMASFLNAPNIDWVKYFWPAAMASAVLIVVGVVATVSRGKGLFDTDLAGGTSVTFILKNVTPVDEVRAKLDKVFDNLVDPATNSRVDHSVYELSMEGQPADTVFKVDSSLEDVSLLQEKVREALKLDKGEDGLKTFEVDVGTVTESEVAAAPATTPSSTPLTAPGTPLPAPTPPTTDNPPESSTEKTPDTPDAKPAEGQPATPTETSEPKAEDKSEKKSEDSGCGGQEDPVEKSTAKSTAEEPAEKTAPAGETPLPKAETPPPTETPTTETPPSGEAADPSTAPAPAPPAKFKSEAVLKFPSGGISHDALVERVLISSKAALNRELDAQVLNDNWTAGDNTPFEEWTVTLPVAKADATKVLNHLKNDIQDDVIWQTSSKIGGQVSVDTRLKAVTALVVSLLGIVGYVWFRFQKVAWGLAAVAALAHDALVMLTGIALSYWLADALGFLGVEEFKISLPVVAAFLTLLGYSVNDTIVIFDRLREIRGKSPVITRQMLNDAVNQTLTRNIILTGITLTVVLILYLFGGPGIHAFAFALVIGVVSGCYTTLVIAAPMLLWLMGRTAPEVVGRAPAAGGDRPAKENAGAGVLQKPSRSA
jgi:SecD/SecF fusion protein